MSTPASTARQSVPTALPAPSWVCKCTGTVRTSFNAEIKRYDASGLSNPAISFMATMLAPALATSLAMFT